jgi:Transposase DNA-binding
MTALGMHESFGETYFGVAELGDVRRTRRLVQVADQLLAHPGGTLPTKIQSPGDLDALYRLANRPEVTHQTVLAPVRDMTLTRIEDHPGTVLVLHDTTELDYTSLSSLKDELGQIGDGGGRGYECHNSLAIDPRTKEVFGLTQQILHHREDVPKKESVTDRRERESRESRLWLQGTVGLPDQPRIVDVCDRAADTFEFLQHELRSGRTFVIRSQHDRSMSPGHDTSAPRRRLHKFARSLPSLGTRSVEVGLREDRLARTAALCVAVAAVSLHPPHVRRGEYQRAMAMPMYVVRVWEPNPLPGERPLEWMLLTNHPCVDFAGACQAIGFYEKRWVIEELHKAMKTGLSIEEMQFTTTGALEPMIALFSTVAVALLNLRAASRQPDAKTRKATELFSPHYVDVLCAWRHRELRPEWTIHDFFHALARLGGHQNRKGDKQPGWLVLWRGWIKLQSMREGADAMSQLRCGET